MGVPGITRSTERRPLIGRTREIAIVEAALTDARLVTLTGLGGVGKTRLAVAVAERMATDASPARVIDLAAVSNPADVPAAVAASLDVADLAHLDLSSAIAAKLARGPSLLVLDNFEHVLAAREFVEVTLERAAPLRVLATSRVPLGIRGERELPLDPLPVPDSVAALETSEAGQLFLRDAREHGNALDDGPDAEAIVNICRRLDGLPLALELAAAWTRLLSPRAIVRRIDEGRLELVDEGGGRHESLHRIVESTLDAASVADRAAFEALAIFVGGFDERAAAAVTGIDDVLPVLRRLEALALLRAVAEPDGEPRFRMLETIRSVGAARLAQRPDALDVRQTFIAHYAARAQVAADAMRDTEPEAALAWMTREIGNLHAAFEGAIRAADAPLAVQLAMTMATYAVRSGGIRESLRRVKAALEIGRVEPAIRSEALNAVANMSVLCGETADVLALSQEAVDLAREVGNPKLEVRALITVASMGRPDNAAELLERAIALATETRYVWAAGVATENLGALYADQGRLKEALEVFRRAWARASEVGDTEGAGHALSCAAGIGLLLGNVEDAVEQATRAVAITRASWPESPMLASAVSLLGSAEALAGRLGEAYDHLAEACAIALASESAVAYGDVLEDAVTILAAEHPLEAAQAAGCRDALDKTVAPSTVSRSLRDRSAEKVRRSLGRRRFEAGRTTGQALEARGLLERIRTLARTEERGTSRRHAQYGAFTARERDVLTLLARGRTDSEIAAELVISPKTASVHVTNIKGKFGVGTRVEAALLARELVE